MGLIVSVCGSLNDFCGGFLLNETETIQFEAGSRQGQLCPFTSPGLPAGRGWTRPVCGDPGVPLPVQTLSLLALGLQIIPGEG